MRKAMASDPSHQQGVSKLKQRVPRHIRNDSEVDTPLVQRRSWPTPQRWYEAHKEEIKRWKENAPRSVQETMEIVRKDLATVPPLFSPARFTTIVEGRPVQALSYRTQSPLGIELSCSLWGFREKIKSYLERFLVGSALVHLSLGLRFR